MHRNSMTEMRTERLELHLADPDSDAECRDIIRIYNDPHAGQGGNSNTGMNTIADVRRKHELMGPQTRGQLCTLAAPPNRMYWLMYHSNLNAPEVFHEAAEDRPVLIGFIALSFRPEMPYPDLGYAILARYEGCGYASEAGREVVRYWRDIIGIKEIWAGTLSGNEKSQRCAVRIGFVRAGDFTIEFGRQHDFGSMRRFMGTAFVLPGMQWTDGVTIRPTIGTETEAQRTGNMGFEQDKNIEQDV